MLKLVNRSWAGLLLGWLCAVASAEAAARQTLEVRDFRLRKSGQDQAVFTVEDLGVIHVRVRVKQPLVSAPARVRLIGPDGVQVEKRGSSPLKLHYVVGDEGGLGTWKAVVDNVGKFPIFTGQVKVDFEEKQETAGAKEVATPHPGSDMTTPTAAGEPVTDGRLVSAESRRRIRAVCRDKNRDVFVRLDMNQRTGGYYMGYNRIFDLEPRYESDDVIHLHQGPDADLRLDTRRKVIYFEGGEEGLFCKVRLYHGDP